MSDLPQEIVDLLVTFQKNEITEHHIYKRLARRADSPENAGVLKRIAAHELQHYRIWRTYSGRDVRPDWGKVWRTVLMAKIFGFTFVTRMMESGEKKAQASYEQLVPHIREARQVIAEEDGHEEELLNLLDEKRLAYTSSIVLGLNDALVELTGALAGLTLALRDTSLIALTGLITGIAAAMSMGASEYLATKSEEGDKNPLKASIYTGIAYLITVFVLILPYLALSNYFVCLLFTMAGAVLIIACFNYYISVAKQLDFKARFLEMAGLSFGVAGLSFIIGWLVRVFLGVDV